MRQQSGLDHLGDDCDRPTEVSVVDSVILIVLDGDRVRLET